MGHAARRLPLRVHLELAATLGIALVAVTVGVRLDDGRLGGGGLTVLLSHPSCNPAARGWARRGTPARSSSAVADRILALLDTCDATRALRHPPSPWGGVSFSYPSRPGGISTNSTRAPSRATLPRSSVRAEREEHNCKPDPRFRRTGHPGRIASVTTTSRRATSAHGAAQLAWVPQRPTLLRRRGSQDRSGGEVSDERVPSTAPLTGAEAVRERTSAGL